MMGVPEWSGGMCRVCGVPLSSGECCAPCAEREERQEYDDALVLFEEKILPFHTEKGKTWELSLKPRFLDPASPIRYAYRLGAPLSEQP